MQPIWPVVVSTCRNISLVVNFTMSKSIESYTHRISCRTGRAGKKGVAITFLGDEDAGVMYDLRQIIGKSSISKVPDELRRHEAAHVKTYAWWWWRRLWREEYPVVIERG